MTVATTDKTGPTVPTHAELDARLAALASHAYDWTQLAPRAKADLLQETRRLLGIHAQHIVDLSVIGKGIPPASPWAGEEWLTGPWAIANHLNGYIRTLRALEAGRKPTPVRVRTRPDGQVVARVFPTTLADRVMVNGVTADVWMQHHVTAATLEQHTASGYPDPGHNGQTALVLGGGNVSSIPALDVLYELLAHQRVVLLKMNPVNDYLTEVLRDVFEPLIRAGYVDIVRGDTKAGEHLTQHPLIDKIHITGSARSHDAIVFGPGKAGARRKATDNPRLNKPISSELGGVGPVIVVPGPWSPTEVDFHAENIATMRLHNAGSNCVAAQCVLLPRQWEPGRRLVSQIRRTFTEVPPRTVHYPGAQESLDEVRRHYPDAEVFGEGKRQRILVTALDDTSDPHGFERETFSPALFEVTLPPSDPADFLRAAVDFANRRLMGTLGATILIHPTTRRELGTKFDAALADLRYGAIGVNVWNAVAFLLADATWGAFPGHTLADIQSGIGVVHNSLLFESPEKTVVSGPFAPFPRSIRHRELNLSTRPPWLVTHRRAAEVGREASRFAIDPDLSRLGRIVANGLRP